MKVGFKCSFSNYMLSNKKALNIFVNIFKYLTNHITLNGFLRIKYRYGDTIQVETFGAYYFPTERLDPRPESIRPGQLGPPKRTGA